MEEMWLLSLPCTLTPNTYHPDFIPPPAAGSPAAAHERAHVELVAECHLHHGGRHAIWHMVTEVPRQGKLDSCTHARSLTWQAIFSNESDFFGLGQNRLSVRMKFSGKVVNVTCKTL